MREGRVPVFSVVVVALALAGPAWADDCVFDNVEVQTPITRSDVYSANWAGESVDSTVSHACSEPYYDVGMQHRIVGWLNFADGEVTGALREENEHRTAASDSPIDGAVQRIESDDYIHFMELLLDAPTHSLRHRVDANDQSSQTTGPGDAWSTRTRLSAGNEVEFTSTEGSPLPVRSLFAKGGKTANRSHDETLSSVMDTDLRGMGWTFAIETDDGPMSEDLKLMDSTFVIEEEVAEGLSIINAHQIVVDSNGTQLYSYLWAIQTLLPDGEETVLFDEETGDAGLLERFIPPPQSELDAMCPLLDPALLLQGQDPTVALPYVGHCVQLESLGSVEARIQALIEDIEQQGLPAQTARPAIAKLEAAIAALERDQVNAACGSLRAFLQFCAAQSGKHLTQEQAEEFTAAVEGFRVELGCG